MICILCRGKKFTAVAKRVRDSLHHRVVQCRRCSHLQITPIPLVEEDRKFYDEGRQFKNIGEPTAIKGLRASQRTDTERRVAMVAKLLPRGARVLDIGSGFGFFLEDLRKRGLRAEGLEISRFARRISKKITAAPVFNMDLTYELPNKTYDAVTLFMVGEHLPDPVQFFRRVKNILGPKGQLIIEVPNAADHALRMIDAYRDFFWQRSHLSYFTKKTLNLAIKKAGLKITKTIFTQRYSLVNLFNWLINGRPQLKKPSFSAPDNLRWLEEYYKQELSRHGRTDTLIIIAQKKS